jgi:hypothetical protein
VRLESLVTISRIKTLVIEVIAVTLIWVLFYRLSLWIFSYFEYNPRVYWIFLPAGIRMISVFIFGWAGVLGLFIGSVITNDAEMSHYVVYLAAISSLSPMLAIRLCKWCYNITDNLKGLKGKQLIGFALTGAFANALFSSMHFYYSGIPKSVDDFLPMFVGDLLGSIIILYLSQILIRLAVKLYKPPPRRLAKKNDLLDHFT